MLLASPKHPGPFSLSPDSRLKQTRPRAQSMLYKRTMMMNGVFWMFRVALCRLLYKYAYHYQNHNLPGTRRAHNNPSRSFQCTPRTSLLWVEKSNSWNQQRPFPCSLEKRHCHRFVNTSILLDSPNLILPLRGTLLCGLDLNIQRANNRLHLTGLTHLADSCLGICPTEKQSVAALVGPEQLVTLL